MPELPEVETICRDLKAILKKEIISVKIRNFKLRRPIPKNLPKILKEQKIQKIWRRGKYILLDTNKGTLIIHLGMSGNLQIKAKKHDIEKHEHINIIFKNNLALCYTDPRRFGLILWTTKEPLKHPLLKNLGPEPLTKNFTADYLLNKANSRKCPIKQLLMDNKIVTGIGNIYASEILFAAKINPLKKANSIKLAECKKLVKETKKILQSAIKYKGTTIRDHKDGRGQQGNFQKKLKAYGRENKPCLKCKTKLKKIEIGGRATYFCPKCQKNTTC